MTAKGAVALVFVVAMFINIIDATVVNVALPTIAADLGVPVELTATVNIGFLVAVAVAIPVAGWLGDRFGAREVFVCRGRALHRWRRWPAASPQLGDRSW